MSAGQPTQQNWVHTRILRLETWRKNLHERNKVASYLLIFISVLFLWAMEHFEDKILDKLSDHFPGLGLHQWEPWIMKALDVLVFFVCFGLILMAIRTIWAVQIAKLRSGPKAKSIMTLLIIGFIGAGIGSPLAIGIYWLSPKNSAEKPVASSVAPALPTAQPQPLRPPPSLPASPTQTETPQDAPTALSPQDELAALRERKRQKELEQQQEQQAILDKDKNDLVVCSPMLDYAVRSFIGKIQYQADATQDTVINTYTGISCIFGDHPLPAGYAEIRLKSDPKWSFVVRRGATVLGTALIISGTASSPRSGVSPAHADFGIHTENGSSGYLQCSVFDYGGDPLFGSPLMPINECKTAVDKAVGVLLAAQVDYLNLQKQKLNSAP
jgi:hypothetical protein